MTTNEDLFRIETLPFKSKKTPKTPPYPLPTHDICWTFLSRRQGGKTLHMINVIRAYAKSMETIIVLSPTVHLDPKWKAIADLKNVFVSSVANNKVLGQIVETQEQSYDKDDPTKNRLLLVIDDYGNEFRRSSMRTGMNKLFTLFRHYGGNLIVAVQSISHMEGIQMTNSMQWTIWDCNNRQLKKLANDLATARMNEDALKKFVQENTKKPYSFVFIDYDKPHDETFRIGFDRIYNPTESQ